MFAQGGGNLPDDDLACGTCGAPLLSKKSTCPRCGEKGSHTVASSAAGAGPSTHVPPSDMHEDIYLETASDDILTSLMIFVAGIGVLFALVSPFIEPFSMVSLWRTLVIFAISLLLLGLRRVMLRV